MRGKLRGVIEQLGGHMSNNRGGRGGKVRSRS